MDKVDEHKLDKFDEYKFFTERAEHRSDRRQQTSQIYLTVNTAIFGIFALLIKDSGLHGWNLAIAMLPLFCVGISVCITWSKIILEFRRVIGWHYEQLREMENGIKGSHKMHSKEWVEIYKVDKSKKGFSFSDLEVRMPFIFIGIYVVYIVGLIIAVKNGLL